MSQAPLFPVSETEFQGAAYALARLLQMIDDEEASWREAREAHKETMAVLKKGVTEQRQVIRRAQLEREEGLTARQVEALLNEAEEREP